MDEMHRTLEEMKQATNAAASKAVEAKKMFNKFEHSMKTKSGGYLAKKKAKTDDRSAA